MKKLILCTALIAISLQAKLYAQSGTQSYYEKEMAKSKTTKTFNTNDGFINIRDFVTLKEGKMILELSDITDYENFRNLDSILGCFLRDVAFYKDSLEANAPGHTRVDYVTNPDQTFTKIRFKKYHADGDIFINQQGDISRLKMEQDTVRIIVMKTRPGIGRHNGNTPNCTIPYSIQVTFLVDNYSDVGKIVRDKVLAGIVDTLEQTTKPKKQKKVNHPEYYYFIHPVSIIYNPYFNGEGNFKRYDFMMSNEYDLRAYSFRHHHKNGYISVNPKIGAGLVRGTVSPMADLGVQYNSFWGQSSKTSNIIRLSVSPYYFFDKDVQGNNIVNDNWFVNASLGTIEEKNLPGWVGKESSFGVGYLVYGKGGVFKNNTFKAFTDVLITKGITIAPEVIFTNNFKQIFPGLTVKIF